MRAGSARTAEFMALKRWLTACRRRFFALFAGLPDKQLSGTAHDPGRYSRLSRYIHQSGQFSKVNQRVKPNAFLPQPPELKISSVWIDDLGEPQIWRIGDVLGAQRPVASEPIARADFGSGILPETKLTIEPDPKPHPRHVNLCGWPREKDAQKDIAMILCQRSSLRVRDQRAAAPPSSTDRAKPRE